MTRSEYIEQLRVRLAGLSKTEIIDAISYCNEYFDEAGEENIQQAIADLGTPSRFAAQLRADAIMRSTTGDEANLDQELTPRRSLKNLWMMILGICALPLALPLGLALIILIFALLLTAAALTFALVLMVVATFVAGIVAIPTSILTLSSGVGNSLVGIGVGLVSIGVSFLLLILVIFLMKKTVPNITKMVTRFYERYRRKEKQI